MTWDVALPNGLEQQLLWSEESLTYLAAIYAFDDTQLTKRIYKLLLPVASTLAAIILGAIVVPGIAAAQMRARLLIATTIGVGVLLMFICRARFLDRKWHSALILLEVVAVPAILLLIGIAIKLDDIYPQQPLISLPLTDEQIAKAAVCAATVLFVLSGGNRIVRAVLWQVKTLPKKRNDLRLGFAGQKSSVATHGEEEDVDEQQVRRGRLIGSLERGLALILLFQQKYEALAFLIAAKGLIRAKDMEDRDFAEYILVGSLTSALVAVVGAFVCLKILARL
jgi:hypothetical protein